MNLKSLAESRIAIDVDICSGKPRIKGTRVAVSDILLAMAEGLSETEIIRNFRSIRKEDLRAVVAYCYCIADNIPLKISSSFGEDVLIANDPNMLIEQEEDAQKKFAEALAAQAAIQDEITKDKLEKIKEEKAKDAQPKLKAPDLRAYDLEIDIPENDTMKIYAGKEKFEQGLNMRVNNYIFETRNDGNLWLTYSVKDGVEIDRTMKRSIKLKYYDKKNKLWKEGIFEGYLTNDRLHKIFLQKDDKGKTCGRAL